MHSRQTNPVRNRWSLTLALGASLLWTCSDEPPEIEVTSDGDKIAPASITDLAVSGETATTVDLTWTAPGDDGVICSQVVFRCQQPYAYCLGDAAHQRTVVVEQLEEELDEKQQHVLEAGAEAIVEPIIQTVVEAPALIEAMRRDWRRVHRVTVSVMRRSAWRRST